MRIVSFAAFVAVVLAGSASIAAQESTNVFAPRSKPSSQPRFLFPTPPPALKPPPKSTVVCGLTVIPGDPNVDPAIRREIPADGRKFAIASVDPKVCQPPK